MTFVKFFPLAGFYFYVEQDLQRMSRFKYFLLITAVMAVLWYVDTSYDTDLKKPDGFGGGYNLTSLGKLVYYPWQVDTIMFNGTNLMIYDGDSLLSSQAMPYFETERRLVFRLSKDGYARCWLRTDSNNREEGNRSMKGSWVANFNDSSISIIFEDSRGKIAIAGKYVELSSASMKIQQTRTVDSTINGQHKKYTLKTTTVYEHASSE